MQGWRWRRSAMRAPPGACPDDFSQGVIAGGGIGLRLFLPFVNMIRLDFALGDGSAHAHFGINEKSVAQRNRVR